VNAENEVKPPKERKRCRKCGREKRAALFPPNARMLDGLSSSCMSCHRHAVLRSQGKARARALLEEARFHEELADEFGGHEWRHKRAASLREEAEEILATV
jgi:hypothetical protein